MKTNSLYEPLLLEAAWEVCNKVGGIYTVIATKVPYMMERWGEQYCTVGPLESEDLPIEFQPASDYSDAFGKAVLKLREAGIKAEYGYWMVDGRPKVILLPVYSMAAILPKIKGEFAKNHQVFIPNDTLLNNVAAFGFLITELTKALSSPEVTDKKVIAHIHEWMSGTCLPEIKRQGINVKTIFTTHATSLARFMAMNEPNFYYKLSTINWRVAARKYGIEAQVSIERLAAHNADIMSTVSSVTDKECEYLLGRKADILLPNGLNIKRFVALHEFQNLHLKYKKKIHEFVSGHFFNNYTFDLDNTVYFFTSGRYEYVNKGYDVTLEALFKLNKRLKQAGSKITVVMFFITKRPFHTINPLVLELRNLLEELKQTTEAIKEEVGKQLFEVAATSGEVNLPDLNQFVSDYWQFRYKKTILSWKTKYLPILVTHNLKDDQGDDILNFLRQKQFYNQPDNPVKIIYHPDFIDSTNPLFKMDYQDFVRGCHLGVFPSYYEPWGYTPVECIAKGIPTITSDLSGFGNYAKSTVRNLDEKGIYVVRRRTSTREEIIDQLTDYMYDFVQQTRRERINQRNHAEGIADKFAWQTLGRHYMEAYRMVMEKY